MGCRSTVEFAEESNGLVWQNAEAGLLAQGGGEPMRSLAKSTSETKEKSEEMEGK